MSSLRRLFRSLDRFPVTATMLSKGIVLARTMIAQRLPSTFILNKDALDTEMLSREIAFVPLRRKPSKRMQIRDLSLSLRRRRSFYVKQTRLTNIVFPQVIRNEKSH